MSSAVKFVLKSLFAPAQERSLDFVPGGPFAVGVLDGCFSYDDDSERRNVGYRLFYPAAEKGGEPALYFPDPKVRRSLLTMPGGIGLYPVTKDLCRLQLPAGQNAPAAEGRFPVIVYSHGYLETAGTNSLQMLELASRGYAVMGICHPGESFGNLTGKRCLGADGKKTKPFGKAADDYMKISGMSKDSFTAEQMAGLLVYGLNKTHIQSWVEDTVKALDELERLDRSDSLLRGRLDTENAGLFGHSYGGASSFSTPFRDGRVKAAVNIDGLQYGGQLQSAELPVPGLYVSETDDPRYLRASFGDPGENPLIFEVAGADHMSFIDYGVVMGDAFRALGFVDEKALPAEQVSEILNRALTGFFDRHLKCAPEDGLSELAEECECCRIIREY